MKPIELVGPLLLLLCFLLLTYVILVPLVASIGPSRQHLSHRERLAAAAAGGLLGCMTFTKLAVMAATLLMKPLDLHDSGVLLLLLWPILGTVGILAGSVLAVFLQSMRSSPPAI